MHSSVKFRLACSMQPDKQKLQDLMYTDASEPSSNRFSKMLRNWYRL